MLSSMLSLHPSTHFMPWPFIGPLDCLTDFLFLIRIYWVFLSGLMVVLHLSYQSSCFFLVSLFRLNFRILKDGFLFLIDFLTLLFAHADFLLFFLKSSSNMRLQNYSQTSSKDFTFLAAPVSFFWSSFLTFILFPFFKILHDSRGFSSSCYSHKLLRQSMLYLLWQSDSLTCSTLRVLWHFPVDWLRTRRIISPWGFLVWLGPGIISCPRIIGCF